MRAAYVWDEPYKAAILETDDNKLPSLLRVAKAVIDKQLQDMQTDHGGTEDERQALIDALAGLNVIRREFERRSQSGPSTA
jgi:hypothetical protein